MSDLTKLEAGKTYVFKQEGSIADWLSGHVTNKLYYHTLYKEGFTIEEVYDSGYKGCIEGHVVIGSDELKYFKLKEEETMQRPKHIRPEDRVTITTTYGELAVALTLLGEVSCESNEGLILYKRILELFDTEYLNLPEVVGTNINFHEVKDEVYAILFPEPTPVESPTQRKARELREQAEELLAKAKELEESV